MKLLCVSLLLVNAAAAWVANSSPTRTSATKLFLSSNNDKKSDDELLESLFKQQQQSSSTPNTFSDSDPKLGIDIGSLLEPLSQKEADEIKAAATEVINDAIASGIDELEQVRQRMRVEIQAQRDKINEKSEARSREQADILLNKIDTITNAFLQETRDSRMSTKRAAAADANMGGRGLEMGVWGNIGDITVTTDSGNSMLLGSVGAAEKKKKQSSGSSSQDDDTATPTDLRIAIVADTKSDNYAKQLVEPLSKKMQELLPNLQVDTFAPTATLPLGANNAQLVLLFLTSLTSANSVKSALDRLLRKTVGANSIGVPPTQIVAISTVGTERTNLMPYSMQNLVGGGKLEKRRQMEEAIETVVRQRNDALDYTIIKLGEINNNNAKEFVMRPGDTLDGNLALDTAVTIVAQAMAIQPAARNATMSVVGSSSTDFNQDLLDDEFLRLDGPEVYRTDLVAANTANYDALVEYVIEWAELLAESGKGLTTPIRAMVSPRYTAIGIVKQREGVQLLYLPTNTGDRYLSKNEEKERRGGSETAAQPTRKVTYREGGLEILVERMNNDSVRVRVRRCNYADGAFPKEITEDTIVSRLKQGLSVWEKDHKN